MKNMIIKEGTDILNRLSPKNQTYLMTLLRLAQIAENGAKNEILNHSQKSPKQKV